MQIKIGVIFGGNSVEHEISIISAVWAMSLIDRNKYEVIPLYITKDKEWYTGRALTDIKNYSDIPTLLRKSKNVVLYQKKKEFVIQKKQGISLLKSIDLAFPIVHGAGAEDGTLQGYLETIGIPYVGSNVIASAVAQDKVIMKQIFAQNNLPITPYIWFFDSDYLEDEKKYLKDIEALGFPVIVKPVNLGSSIGITKASDKKELVEAIETALNYDNKIVVEKVVDNLLEANCSVLGSYEHYTYSAIEEVMGTDEFLSYQDKYVGNAKAKGGNKRKGMANTNRIIPARINKELTKDIQETALKAAKLVNTSGVARIDFLIDKKTNKFYINEINSIPGDLSFYLWQDKKPADLIEELINIAIKRKEADNKKIHSFETNILQNTGNLNGNKKRN